MDWERGIGYLAELWDTGSVGAIWGLSTGDISVYTGRCLYIRKQFRGSYIDPDIPCHQQANILILG